MPLAGSPRASLGRGTRRRLSAALIGAVLASSAFAGSALAAPQSLTIDRTISSGPADLGGTTYIVSGVISGNITVTATATLTQPIRETLSYDDGSLRQGASLAVHRAVAANGAGNLHVVWHIASNIALVPTGDLTDNASCTLSFTGPVSCDAESPEVELLPNPVFAPGPPYADLKFQAHVTVTPGDASVASTELGGSAVVGGPASQAVPGTQTIDIPCTIGKGDTLSLSDADFNLATHINSSNGPAITVGVWLPTPIIIVPGFKSPGVTLNVGPQHAESFDQAFTDASTKVSALGPVAPNNVPPSANAGGPYNGKLEGVPVQFDASGSASVCGFSSLALRWDFSDGGVAFGAHPFHTFTDNGTFSGLLTATDPTGLSNSVAFSVVVGNQNPAVNAGPDTTADWGRVVAFNGQATDPGAADQSTLQYSWDFGDGSPSATGGASVLHAYAAPGTYTATLTVTDKDGGISNDSRDVVVTKRDTITGYLGATAGTYDTPTTLRASLVDEYGANLNGKSIGFTVNGAAAGSGSTNSFGIASTAWTPLLAAGTYGTNAAFSGDALYKPSAGGGSVAIARKATSVTYTGALNGGPNKTVGLSAILADATGTRLAGRTIVFVLGAQTISAVTNASGIASTNLTLNQKNAIYPLTATFTPAGADAGTYLASSDAESFKLQKK